MKHGGRGRARQPSVPFEPLRQALTRRGISLYTAAKLAGLNTSGIYRADARGRITVWVADQVAVAALDQHPTEIWGNDWTDPDIDQAGIERAVRIDLAFQALKEAAA